MAHNSNYYSLVRTGSAQVQPSVYTDFNDSNEANRALSSITSLSS